MSPRARSGYDLLTNKTSDGPDEVLRRFMQPAFQGSVPHPQVLRLKPLICSPVPIVPVPSYFFKRSLASRHGDMSR